VNLMTLVSKQYAVELQTCAIAGSYYRTIQQYMIDMENMFDLLATTPKLQVRFLPLSRSLCHAGCLTACRVVSTPAP
jgi:ABC-type transport system involved in Fe-S cluster assembly fused permease/ATPase subunit